MAGWGLAIQPQHFLGLKDLQAVGLVHIRNAFSTRTGHVRMQLALIAITLPKHVYRIHVAGQKQQPPCVHENQIV